VLAKHILCEANRAAARVLVFSMSERVRMMTCSFGRCSTHSGLAIPYQMRVSLVSRSSVGLSEIVGSNQASAARNYSAPISSEDPATIRIDKGESRVPVGRVRDRGFIV
jgi:hypothetical protein